MWIRGQGIEGMTGRKVKAIYVVGVSIICLGATSRSLHAQDTLRNPISPIVDTTHKTSNVSNVSDTLRVAHDTTHAVVHPQWTFGAWGGIARHQMLLTRVGHVHDRDLYLLAFRATRPFKSKGGWTFDYTVDVLPVFIATANREYTAITVPCTPSSPFAECSQPQTVLIPSRHTAYGFGLTPFGIRSRYPLSNLVQAAFALSAGGAYFDRKIPDPKATRFNFTIETNAGLLFHTKMGSVSGGLRGHHISNGYTGHVNPGINSLLWFIGFER